MKANEMNVEVINAIANEIATENAAIAIETINITSNNTIAATNKVAEVEEAIKAIKNAIAAVKAEMLSPRAIVRAIRDTMQSNSTIATFAAKIGIAPNSNKKAIDASAKRLLELVPYYTVTKIPYDGGVTEIVDIAIMQPTSVEGVYVARTCKDIFALLAAAWSNDENTHIEVKPGKFYKFDADGNIEETGKVTISRKSDKEEAKKARLKKAVDESTIEEIKEALIAKFGLEMLRDYINN